MFRGPSVIIIIIISDLLCPYQIPDDDDRDGPRNVGSIHTPDAADSTRRLHGI
jgi:hypothetical protein